MARISEATITYSCRSEALPRAEENALLAIYRRAIARYDQGKEGGATTAPYDGKKESMHVPAEAKFSPQRG
jgi:hypothetical protein